MKWRNGVPPYGCIPAEPGSVLHSRVIIALTATSYETYLGSGRSFSSSHCQARLFGKAAEPDRVQSAAALPSGFLGPPFDQTAAQDRCCEFARQLAVKTSEISDEYKFQDGEPEGNSPDQLLVFPYSHLVQTASHLAESRCPIRLKDGSPADESFLAEH